MDIVEELRHKANNKLRRVVEDMSLQNRQLLAALQAVPQYFEVKKDNPL
jgi:hypothetical protein